MFWLVVDCGLAGFQISVLLGSSVFWFASGLGFWVLNLENFGFLNLDLRFGDVCRIWCSLLETWL